MWYSYYTSHVISCSHWHCCLITEHLDFWCFESFQASPSPVIFTTAEGIFGPKETEENVAKIQGMWCFKKRMKRHMNWKEVEKRMKHDAQMWKTANLDCLTCGCEFLTDPGCSRKPVSQSAKLVSTGNLLLPRVWWMAAGYKLGRQCRQEIPKVKELKKDDWKSLANRLYRMNFAWLVFFFVMQRWRKSRWRIQTATHAPAPRPIQKFFHIGRMPSTRCAWRSAPRPVFKTPPHVSATGYPSLRYQPDGCLAEKKKKNTGGDCYWFFEELRVSSFDALWSPNFGCLICAQVIQKMRKWYSLIMDSHDVCMFSWFLMFGTANPQLLGQFAFRKALWPSRSTTSPSALVDLTFLLRCLVQGCHV